MMGLLFGNHWFGAEQGVSPVFRRYWSGTEPEAFPVFRRLRLQVTQEKLPVQCLVRWEILRSASGIRMYSKRTGRRSRRSIGVHPNTATTPNSNYQKIPTHTQQIGDNQQPPTSRIKSEIGTLSKVYLEAQPTEPWIRFQSHDQSQLETPHGAQHAIH